MFILRLTDASHALFRETKLYSEAGEKRRQIPPSFHYADLSLAN
jgi:hypothetical protein